MMVRNDTPSLFSKIKTWEKKPSVHIIISLIFELSSLDPKVKSEKFVPHMHAWVKLEVNPSKSS